MFSVICPLSVAMHEDNSKKKRPPLHSLGYESSDDPQRRIDDDYFGVLLWILAYLAIGIGILLSFVFTMRDF